MAELSVRQGRLAEAVAIYRHLVGGNEPTAGRPPGDVGRIQRWQLRLAELDGGGALVPAPATSAAEEPAPRALVGKTADDPARTNAAQRASLIVREPVRSGQLIYAEGADLIVVASVHSGAQLLADGNIH